MIILIIQMGGNGNQNNKLIKMKLEDLKLYGLNFGALGISMTEIELVLKVMVLMATLGYTIHRWYLMNKEK